MLVAAHAHAPFPAKLVTVLLVVTSFVVSALAASQHKTIGRVGLAGAAAVVGVASAFAVRAAFHSMHVSFALAIIATTAVGGLAAVSLAWALVVTRVQADVGPLDADERALVPTAAWLGVAAVIVRFGAEATHLHVVVPLVAMVMAVLSAGVASFGVVLLLDGISWIRKVYAGEAGLLRITALSEHDRAVPSLTELATCDAAIIEVQGEDGPYREQARRRALARAPADPNLLMGRLTKRLRVSGLLAAGLLATAVLVIGPFARAAHPGEGAIPTKLRPLPGTCAADRPVLRFAALEPLTLVDVESFAARYRDTGVVTAETLAALGDEDRFFNGARQQVIGEEILAAARRAYKPRGNELVVVVTDRDMYLREMDWRFALAVQYEGVAVVSIARMDGTFGRLDGSSLAHYGSACRVELRARAFKMITRQLLRACHASAVDDARSARRPAVMSLDDLDQIDESSY
jgi:hypothetical protein